MAYQLYVSSNRGKHYTKRKIEKILSKRHEGFSLVPITGYWKGRREASWLIIIEDELEKVYFSVMELQIALKQEVIGWQEVPTITF